MRISLLLILLQHAIASSAEEHPHRVVSRKWISISESFLLRIAIWAVPIWREQLFHNTWFQINLPGAPKEPNFPLYAGYVEVKDNRTTHEVFYMWEFIFLFYFQFWALHPCPASPQGVGNGSKIEFSNAIAVFAKRFVPILWNLLWWFGWMAAPARLRCWDLFRHFYFSFFHY